MESVKENNKRFKLGIEMHVLSRTTSPSMKTVVSYWTGSFKTKCECKEMPNITLN
jgi:hypothetical protein